MANTSNNTDESNDETIAQLLHADFKEEEGYNNLPRTYVACAKVSSIGNDELQATTTSSTGSNADKNNDETIAHELQQMSTRNCETIDYEKPAFELCCHTCCYPNPDKIHDEKVSTI